MQQILFVLGTFLLLCWLVAVYGDDRGEPRHILPVTRIEVIDGDSFRVMVSTWPGQVNQSILRLDGWDAPEST